MKKYKGEKLDRITFYFEDIWIHPETKNYLENLNGVKQVIDKQNNDLDVFYDNKLISLNLLYQELCFFNDAINTPYLTGFDKHSSKKLVKKQIVIKDACCQYCLRRHIEDLLLVPRIEILTPHYDIHDFLNVIIDMEIDEMEVINIERKLNMKDFL